MSPAASAQSSAGTKPRARGGSNAAPEWQGTASPHAQPVTIDPQIWPRNLSALHRAQPKTAELVSAANLPAGAIAVAARDGSPTFVWSDAVGCERWHGRTQAPRIRAEALLERFQIGHGNTVLVGIGHGTLLHGLLQRLDPSQVVLVIEADAAALAMTLRLFDCSDTIDEGRLALFVGASAWDDLHEHLAAADGCLVPDRTLSWPWFTQADVTDITDRLGVLGRSIAQKRDAAIKALKPNAEPPQPGQIAVAAVEPRGPACILARRLARAAGAAGFGHVAAIADSPRMRHPLALARQLASTRCTWIVAVNTLREMLPPILPDDQRLCVWLSDDAAVTAELVARIGPRDRLVVPLLAQADAARAGGLDEGRLRHVPIGADADARVADAPESIRCDAEAVGLRLSSQRALWDALTKIIRQRMTYWCDKSAPVLLAEAEQVAGVRLSSDEVRGAILDRVRAVLGPGVERESYLAVWRERFADPIGDGGLRASGAAATALPILCLPPGGRIEANMLNAAAAGRPLLVRSHPGQRDPDGWAAMLEPTAHVSTFSTPAELRSLLERLATRPAEFTTRAEAARAHVLAHHAWAARLTVALADE